MQNQELLARNIGAVETELETPEDEIRSLAVTVERLDRVPLQSFALMWSSLHDAASPFMADVWATLKAIDAVNALIGYREKAMEYLPSPAEDPDRLRRAQHALVEQMRAPQFMVGRLPDNPEVVKHSR
jgi:hypothetical protein